MTGHIAECKTLFTKDENDCDCFDLYRVAVIEECARVADAFHNPSEPSSARILAIIAAVRALKDKND